MSNFYYCNDCKKPVDLETEQVEADHSDFSYDTSNCETVCKECGGTNWHAEIDKGTHYEQVRESKIHPGSTHRVGDIEKLNHSKEVLKIFGIGKE